MERITQKTFFENPVIANLPERPLIYTSYFSNLKRLKADQTVVPVSIARGTPRWAGQVERYLGLAPTREMLDAKLTMAQYDEQFLDILYRLDPRETLAEITSLAGRGRSPVLLCWEKPGDFCHRRHVAEWLEHNCKIVIAEYGLAREATETHFNWT